MAPRQHCTIVRHVPALHTARSSLLGSTHQACGLHGQPGSLATTNTRRRIHEFSIVSIVCSSSSLPSDSAVLYGSDTHTVATTASIHTGNGQESVIGTPSSSSSTTSGVSHSHNSISSNSTSNCSSSSSPSSSSRNGSSILGGIVPLAGGGEELDQPPETGVLPDEAMKQLGTSRNRTEATVPSVSAIASSSSTGAVASAAGTICSPDPVTSPLYPPSERSQIQESWDTLMRWSKVFRKQKAAISPIEAADKIVVFGGGSFGTAMGCALARKKADLDVVLLLRDPYVCKDINTLHRNTKYLKVMCAWDSHCLVVQVGVWDTDTIRLMLTEAGIAVISGMQLYLVLLVFLLQLLGLQRFLHCDAHVTSRAQPDNILCLRCTPLTCSCVVRM